MKKLLLISLLLIGSLFAENSLGVNINDEDVEVLGSVNLNTLNSYADGTTYIVEVSYLYTDGDNLFALGISGQNTFQGLEGLSLALGFKGVFADEYLALPITTKLIYRLPLNDTIPPTSLIGSFAYAPSVLSFRDADSYSEFRIEADMEIISNIHIFTGYRNINTEYVTDDKTFNSSFYGGLRLSF